MIEPGPLLARGRECDVFELGEGRVLRRSRRGDSCEAEAALMQHVAAHGYPVPAVHDAAGPDLVMDRVDGPTMADAMARRPHQMGRGVRSLADLHDRLHRIEAPEGLPAVGDGGRAVIHLDLHPLNVLIGPDGPVVIDWGNASAGLGATDVAFTWVIVATSLPDDSPLLGVVARVLGPWLGKALARHTDLEAARAQLAFAAELRSSDRNLSDEERRRLARFQRRVADSS